MVKQRAKALRDVNNQQQGIAPLQPGTQPGPGTYEPTVTPAPPPQAGINPVQQALIDHLQNDLNGIKPGIAATAQIKSNLQADIENLAKGAIKPTKAETFKLAGDLADALADQAVSAKELPALAKAINVVMNCAPLTQARTQTFATAAQNLLKSSGANDASVKAVGADLLLIINEIQKSKPKLYQ
jgi:hypothetical protein